MKVTITVTASETREVEFSDYDLDEENYTEEDLLDAVEDEINDSLGDFVENNSTGCIVEKAKD